MKKIQLNGNRYRNNPVRGYVLVDDDDYLYLTQFKWHVSWNGYAKRTIVKNKGNFGMVTMARDVMGATIGEFIDHIDGNKLNNQKNNLRFATKSQNGMNRKAPRHNISGYKGVYFDSPTKKWRAEIGFGGARKKLGRFLFIEDAVRAYNIAAKKYHGEFALVHALPLTKE